MPRSSRLALAIVLVASAAVGAGRPAGAAPSWSVVPSAIPGNAPGAKIYDVACPSATSCFAVGEIENVNGLHPLAEHWDGTSWSVMAVPYAAYGIWSNITCASVTSCFVVTSGQAARWDGTAWSIVPLEVPANTSGVYGERVACSSDSNCVAVGGALSKLTSQTTAISEIWDGDAWSAVPIAGVPAVGSLRWGGVACTDASFCVAVGSVYDDNQVSTPVIEQWDGTGWSVAPNPPPDPAATRGVVLNDVSCSSPTSCFAVGYSSADYSTQTAVIDKWNGSVWSSVPAPTPPAPASDTNLVGVACPAAASCFAVGTGIEFRDSSYGLIEHWDGTSWANASSPIADTNIGSFLGINCASAVSCFGVTCASYSTCFGLDDHGASPQAVEHWDGSTWSSTRALVDPAPPDDTLTGVSCATASTCFAVGYRMLDFGRTPTALIERPNATGTSWAAVANPKRPGAVSSVLAGVSCPTAITCFAVGNRSAYGKARTLIERWNGTAWSVMQSANARRPKQPLAGNRLVSVSCVSATDCMAVGTFRDTVVNTLTEHWDGKTWTVVPSPDRMPTGENTLTSVSCAAPNNCFAVGRFGPNPSYNPPTAYKTLVMRWDGSQWKNMPSPNSIYGIGELTGVDCAGGKACVAVGSAYRDSVRKSLVLTWDRAASGADLPGSTHSALTAVSCATATACVAVGNDSGRAKVNETFLKTLTGGRWSSLPGPSPASSLATYLNAVSCVAPTACVAVGQAVIDGAPTTLVERSS